MQRFVSIFLALVFTHLMSPAIWAQDKQDAIYATKAAHLVILDHDSGEVLFEKDARAPMPPASMTKIMTAAVVFDRINSGALSMDDKLFVSVDAWERGGVKSGSSTMFLKPKSEVSVRDLLYGVIVQSGNDACIVLAEGIAGNETAFAGLMNKKAAELGLESANFKNATGWPDEGHVISALDLARLAAYTINTYPELYKIYAETEFTWNGITQPNRNPLFQRGVPGADGLKTGHTRISKYGFVGSAVQDGQRRIVVLNGLDTMADRRTESARVMRSAFGEFKTYGLFDANAKAGSAKVFMGKAETVSLVMSKPAKIGLHKSARDGLVVKIKYNGPIPAPVSKGDHIGDLEYGLAGEQPRTIPLLAGEDVELKSIFGRVSAALVAKIRGE